MNKNEKIVCKIVLKDNREILAEISKEKLWNEEFIFVENNCLSKSITNCLQSVVHKTEIKKLIVFKPYKEYAEESKLLKPQNSESLEKNTNFGELSV